MQPSLLSNGVSSTRTTQTSTVSTVTNTNQPLKTFLDLPSGPIIDYFKSIIKQNFTLLFPEKALYNILKETVFENQDLTLIEQKYESLKISFDAVCSQVIPKETVSYYCLDCDKESCNEKTLVGAICQECFLDSSHEGHRVILRKNKYSEVKCSCGNSSIFESASLL